MSEDNGWAAVPNTLINDGTLDHYAFRFYCVVLAHDWHGDGCTLTYEQIATRMGCSKRQAIRAASVCLSRNLISSSPGRGRGHSSVFHALRKGATQSPFSPEKVPHSHSLPEKVPHSHLKGATQSPFSAVKGATQSLHPIKTSSEDIKTTASSRRPTLPLPESRPVTDAWLAANNIDPSKVLPATREDYDAWTDELLALGYTPDQLVAGLSHVVAARKAAGRRWRITPLILSERIGESIAAAQPEVTESLQSCGCGVQADIGRRHNPDCRLAGLVTSENIYLPWKERQQKQQEQHDG